MGRMRNQEIEKRKRKQKNQPQMDAKPAKLLEPPEQTESGTPNGQRDGKERGIDGIEFRGGRETVQSRGFSERRVIMGQEGSLIRRSRRRRRWRWHNRVMMRRSFNQNLRGRKREKRLLRLIMRLRRWVLLMN